MENEQRVKQVFVENPWAYIHEEDAAELMVSVRRLKVQVWKGEGLNQENGRRIGETGLY